MLFIANAKSKSPIAKQKSTVNSSNPPVYKCTKCGKTKSDPTGAFYLSKTSPLYTANESYSCICADCTNELFDEAKNKYKDEKLALIIICHYMDVYFSEELYESIKSNSNFSYGIYTRSMNGTQYKSKNFTTSLVDIVKLGLKGTQQIELNKEVRWSAQEQINKEKAIKTIGYDPFEGYSETDRRFLFNELIKYFDDDIEDDTWKLSQVIQIVNNNNQIRNIDLSIAGLSSGLDCVTNADAIKALQEIKYKLVNNNDKIAKENEISVKNRSNKEAGKSSFGKLQKRLREMNLKEAEENYYTQLTSIGTQWAIDMSHKSIIENAMFDENDKKEIFDIQRETVLRLQKELNDEKEKNRLLLIENTSLTKGVR